MADQTKEHIHVAAALIERGGKILAAHRVRKMEGFELPGGHVEAGEKSEDAAIREVKEELGIDIVTLGLFDTVEYDYPDFHLTMDVFLAHLKNPEDEPQLREHTELIWLAQDELLSVTWLPADVELVRRLGYFWDDVFNTSHL